MFTIIKSLNKFKHYISQNKILVCTIHSDVRSYILQGELDFDRDRFITKILNYDVEIHPTKVVKGIPLCKYLAKYQSFEHIMIVELETQDKKLLEVMEESKKLDNTTFYIF